MSRFTHTLRGRLTIVAVIGSAVALLVLTAAFNLVLRNSLRSDVDSRLSSHANAALATVHFRGGHLHTTESAGDAALDSGTWIYSGTTTIERPRAGRALQRAADELAASGRRTAALDEDARLLAVPIVSGGRRVGTVVAAASLAAYDRSTDIALIGSALFAFVILLAVTGSSWWITGAALRPVGRMTRQAAEWSDRDLDKRFGEADRSDELGRLAATFDTMLDRVAAALRQEQRLSTELSHELRTPLAKIIAEADLLLRRERSARDQREGLEIIHRGAVQMTAILETLMAAARSESALPNGRVEVSVAAERAVSHVHAAGVELTVAGPPGLIAGVDSEVVERVLAPLLDNAARHARRTVAVRLSRAGGRVAIDVEDDGDGVAAADTERVFEAGVTAANGHSGAGLGLPLARRLARAAGGDVDAQPGPGGRFRVDLPAG
ncbi:MAG: hypothetical protein QOI11_2466 [Candidatus Eremiobacteraeota bacterium]|nr:hypothetical protein [Candidatus Eremiobacteraeota bacterium]